MRESVSPQPMTFAEYMRFEQSSSIRHEFVRGEVYDMVGGTRRHNQIALNIAFHLKAAARGGPCQTFINDVKVQCAEDVVYYPDVAVDCVPRDGQDLIIDEPCLVVEVISRSTRRVDRGEKWENYRRVLSLRVYLVVDQTRRRVTHHWRASNGEWTSEELNGTGQIELPCPKTTLTLDQIYEDVELPPLGVAERDFDSGVEEYETE